MNWYTIVKRHYDAGRYSIEHVAVFVQAGKITPEQYEDLTGSKYQGSAE